MLLAFLLALPGAVPAQVVNPHAIDIPPWFSETFLDLREDIADAAKDSKRLMLYFGQDGCPYCTALMQTSFRQQAIVDKARRHFVAVALNMWGDREVTWTDGRTMREKDFARFLKVQYTPTLLFFDEKGAVVARVNGYYPPARLAAALDYVAGRMEAKLAFAEHMKAVPPEAAGAKLNEQPFLLPPPHDLRRGKGAKPLAVLFETTHCAACDEMHREGFARPEVRTQVTKFDVVRLHVAGDAMVTTPDGRRLRADAWARELKVAYTPTLVFFGPRGREAFRIEAYVRPFHLAGAFAYVASGAYAREPSFQRYLQAHADELKRAGRPVEIWK